MFSVSVSFNVTAIDKRRLERYLRKEFGATELRLIVESDQAVFVRPHESKGITEIIALARDKKVFRWREIAGIRGARSCLERLVNAGALKRVQHGVYAVADAGDVQRLTAKLGPYQSKLGSRQEAVFNLLRKPRTAPEIQVASGVTRQAINQLLQKLVAKGLVRRVPAIGEGAEWLYVQAGTRLDSALLRRIPKLSPLEEKVLNLLSPAGGVLLRDLREVVPGCFGPLERLTLKRLIDVKKFGHQKLLQITGNGLKHDQYRGEPSPLAVYSEDMLVAPERLQIMLAMAALGPARALDITPASETKPKNGSGTGQLLGLMKRSGLVHQSKQAGKAPIWSLTAKGSAVVAQARRNGNDITAEAANLAVSAARRERTVQAARHATNQAAGRSIDILRVLKERGPIHPRTLQRALPIPFENPRSIYLALKTLRARGLAKSNEARDQFKRLWQLTPAGDLFLGHHQ